MFISIRRIAVAVERIPLSWSDFWNIERRVECGGNAVTWDCIVGGVRIIASLKR